MQTILQLDPSVQISLIFAIATIIVVIIWGIVESVSSYYRTATRLVELLNENKDSK